MNVKNKRIRLDRYLADKGFVPSRHQAADLIKQRQVKLNDKLVTKPALMVDPRTRQRVQLLAPVYASRGGHKLASALEILRLDFKDKVILDVGAHKGGFSDCINRYQPSLIVAVDSGSQVLDASLSNQAHIISFTATDIRDFKWPQSLPLPDFIIVDVSFISITKILESLLKFCQAETQIIILAKPQFETDQQSLNKGIVKNQQQRRQILRSLEVWLQDSGYRIINKTDAGLSGLKGNLERFYLIQPLVQLLN